jgi:hypothetical protein
MIRLELRYQVVGTAADARLLFPKICLYSVPGTRTTVRTGVRKVPQMTVAVFMLIAVAVMGFRPTAFLNHRHLDRSLTTQTIYMVLEYYHWNY